MTRGVGRKAGNACAFGQALDDFGPQDEGERGAGIASRFGAKQDAQFCTELAALLKIGFKKVTGNIAVAHHSLGAVFGMLSSYTDLPVRKIEITDRKTHQFLTAKRSIVGEKEHDLVAEPFAFENAKHF